MKSISVFNKLLTPSSLLLTLVAYNAHADEEQTTRQLSSITVIGSEATVDAEIGGTAVKELPINVHVVNQEEIERLRFVDPDELLDRIPGETQVRNLRIPDGGKPYTIPLVDGIPLENPYQGATQRIDRVNTSDIQRIEVIKGPASAIYPNNAFGGVINVVTREAPKEAKSELWLELGNFNRIRTGLSTGGTVNKLGYFVDLNTRNIDGHREGAQNDRDQISAKLIYDPTSSTRLITRLEYLEEEIVALGDLTQEQLDEDDRQRGGAVNSDDELEQQSVSFKLEQLFDNSNLDFSFVYREKDTVGQTRFRGLQDENDVGYSTKLLYRYDFASSNIITGFETYDGDQNTVRLVGNPTPTKGSRDIRALFAQYEIDLTSKLGLTLGARYEHIKISSSSLDNNPNVINGSASFNDISPKFGLTYDLNPNNMLWLGVSRGFLAPDLDDVYGDADNPETANLALEGEEATNIEVGLRGSYAGLSYDTSYYHNRIKNYLVTQEFGDIGAEFERTTNAGKVTVQGLETVLEYSPQNSNWRASLTHTYARNIYDSFVSSDGDFSGNELARSPKHHFNGRFAWLPTEHLTMELEGDFYTSYFSDIANSEAGKFTRDERINLRASYDKGPWRLWFHALNLTNTLEDRATYRVRRGVGTTRFRTVDGRTFYGGVAYQF